MASKLSNVVIFVMVPRLPSLCARPYVASLSRSSHSNFEILAIARSPQISFCTTTSNDLSRFPLSANLSISHYLTTPFGNHDAPKIINNAIASCHTLFGECELARLRTSYPRPQPEVSHDHLMLAFGYMELQSLASLPSRISF